MAHAIKTPHAGFGITEMINEAFGTLQGRLSRRRVYMNTRNELMGLDDRGLSDLGITRSEIDRIASEAAIGSAHH